jgi:hypothetical protein
MTNILYGHEMENYLFGGWVLRKKSNGAVCSVVSGEAFFLFKDEQEAIKAKYNLWPYEDDWETIYCGIVAIKSNLAPSFGINKSGKK